MALAGVLALVALGGYFFSRTKKAREFLEARRKKLLVIGNHITMLVITWQAIANLASVHKFKVRPKSPCKHLDVATLKV